MTPTITANPGICNALKGDVYTIHSVILNGMNSSRNKRLKTNIPLANIKRTFSELNTGKAFSKYIYIFQKLTH